MANYKWGEVPAQSGSDSQGSVSERTREFHLLFRGYVATVDEVLKLRECPRPYDPHPYNPIALAQQPQVDQVNRFEWRIVVSYSTEIDREEQDKNPLNRPAKIAMRATDRNLPVLIDAEGKPLTNHAGDLVPGISVSVKDPVFTVVKNLASPPRWLPEYIGDGDLGSVNSEDVRILGYAMKPRHLKFNFEGLEESQEGKFRFWVLRFNLEYHRLTWDFQYLNVGKRELQKALPKSSLELFSEDQKEQFGNDRLVDILVGEPPRVTSDPVFLDEDGAAIREEVTKRSVELGIAGNIKTRLEKDEIIVIRRKGIPARPFSALPLS